MRRGLCLPLLATLIAASPSPGQSEAPRFRWTAGQTLDYRVEQTTTVAETVDQKPQTVLTKLNVSKRWQVLDVDSSGVAILNLTLLALRMETRKPDGSSVVFDSQKPDPANADLNKEMLRYIGKPIAILRVDGRGQVVEVKESRFGPASRYAAELPFRVTLPETLPAAGQSWERSYQIKMEPPQGAGETYNSVQKYDCQELAENLMTVALETTVKDLPDAPIDRIPLVAMQPKGRIKFDVASGRMVKAELKMAAEYSEHRGEGSKYVYDSTYTEEFVGK